MLKKNFSKNIGFEFTAKSDFFLKIGRISE